MEYGLPAVHDAERLRRYSLPAAVALLLLGGLSSAVLGIALVSALSAYGWPGPGVFPSWVHLAAWFALGVPRRRPGSWRQASGRELPPLTIRL